MGVGPAQMRCGTQGHVAVPRGPMRALTWCIRVTRLKWRVDPWYSRPTEGMGGPYLAQ